MTSQNNSVSTVYQTVCSGANQGKHQSYASLAFVRGIHRRPVNFSQKGPVKKRFLNSLWPGEVIWRHGTRSTLAQIMACCLTAPSHYLNQCWLIISEVPWLSSQGMIIRQCEDTNQNKIENCSFKMAYRSARGQWVNSLRCGMITGCWKSIMYVWRQACDYTRSSRDSLIYVMKIGNEG